MRMLKWMSEFFVQDDFADDAYGWLTNQISHIGLGIALALVLSAVWFYIGGEFPYRWAAWGIISAAYIAGEVARGWAGRDSVEDTVFVCVYGAGGAMLLFCEVTPGSPLLIVSVADTLPVLAIALAHLGWGTFLRA